MIQSSSFNNCIYHYNVKILNIFYPELQLFSTTPIIKDNFKKLSNDLKKFKIQSVLVLKYKKGNIRKVFYSSVKIIDSDSNIDEALKSIHQSLAKKIKTFASEDWVVIKTVVDHSIEIFECYYKQKY